MSGKPVAVLLLVAGGASAAFLWSALAAVLVACGGAGLLAGFAWKRPVVTMASGWLMYPALAVAMTAFLPAALTYVAAALLIVLATESLAFGYEASSVLESPTGVDAAASELASRVIRAHRRREGAYGGAVAAVMLASFATSVYPHYASELIGASALLVLACIYYCGR